MNNRSVQLICMFIVLLCVALCASLYFGYYKIKELRLNYANLTKEYNGLSKRTTDMGMRKRAFTNAFNDLDKLKVGVGVNVDFFDETQKAITRGGAIVQSSSANAPKDNRISMKMSFIGDYYAIIRSFAELRGLTNVVRVVSVNMSATNKDTSVNSQIRADVLLEAMSYSSR